MPKSIFFSLLLLLTITVDAQEKKLPEEAITFMLPGYEMLDYITGDLNNNKKQDAILILKQNGEDTSYDELKRPFIILISIWHLVFYHCLNHRLYSQAFHNQAVKMLLLLLEVFWPGHQL